MRVATDIGGTFTDLVCLEFSENQAKLRVAKSDTTPGQLEKGILNTLDLADISLEEVSFLAHGTTVVINTLTERKGAKTALITTKGFKDVLEIARSNRPDLFNYNFVKQPSFVPRHLCFEVEERLTYKGDIVTPLNTDNLKDIANTCIEEQVEAIAVCFLHAYVNSEHEKQVLKEIRALLPDIPVIASHAVNREWREYERTSSTVLSAYILPTTKNYLDNLNSQLKQKGLKNSFFVMQSNGGINTVNSVKENPITLVESGPASGIIGGAKLGTEIGKKNLIVLDIGGTTAKCSLIENGEVNITTTYKIDHSRTEAGYPIQTPVIDIVEIGNGGGSIAWVDAGGKIHVGPQSAGAYPGPASYGKGGDKITTTDANLFCGRIHPDYFLGGKMKPDMESLNKAFDKLADKLNLSARDIAIGVLRVANASMVNALKLISVNKGYDPRDFSLMVIGGGGGMHAAFLAEELQIPEIIVPVNAGVFSAFGMLMTDLRKDFLQTKVIQLSSENLSYFTEVYQQMEEEAIAGYVADGFKKEEVSFEYFADMRYSGQEHYVKLDLASKPKSEKDLLTLVTQFHKIHKKKYTFELEAVIEWVNFHVVAKVLVDKPVFPKISKAKNTIEEAIHDKVMVDFGAMGSAEATVYDREKFGKGMTLEGPAIIAESSTTTVIPPKFSAKIDDWGNLIIKKNG
ncbi:MAG: hydantoinase/oxoprolinase family protein [Algibacter sp.]